MALLGVIVDIMIGDTVNKITPRRAVVLNEALNQEPEEWFGTKKPSEVPDLAFLLS